MMLRQFLRFPTSLYCRCLTIRKIVSALPVAVSCQRNLPVWRSFGSHCAVSNANTSKCIISELNVIVEEGTAWEDIDASDRQKFENGALACSDEFVVDNEALVNEFHEELLTSLLSGDPGFKTISNYSGFGPKLSMDIAVYYGDELLAFIVVDEPNHYRSNGDLRDFHKIKQLLYNIKYRESVILFRVAAADLQNKEIRQEKIFKLVEYLVSLHFGGGEEEED